MARFREIKLEHLSPHERTNVLERIRGIKSIQHFTERKMFVNFIKSGKGKFQTQSQIKDLKKSVRGELRRYKEITDEGYDSFEATWTRGPFSKDEKLYYGSDSDSALDSFGEESDERINALVVAGNLAHPQQALMYQQFLLDEWRRRNMRQTSKDLIEQNESSGEYDEESGSDSDSNPDGEYDDESDEDVDNAIVQQMMIETSKKEPFSDSDSDLEFEDEERKSPFRA